MSVLVLTVQAAGQVYHRLGGTANGDLRSSRCLWWAWRSRTISSTPFQSRVAIALTTGQSACASGSPTSRRSAPNYLLGAAAAAVVIAVTESSGAWLTLLLTAAPFYLTYKMYRAGRESEARQGAILEAAHDAIITMDQKLNIREFNPAAEQMFGRRRTDILGRNVDLLLPPDDRQAQLDTLTQYMETGGGPLSARRLELTAVRADGTEFRVELNGRPHARRQPRGRDRLHQGHHRTARARRTAAAVAKARSRRPARRRRRARLQQHPDEHHGGADLLMMQLGADDPARGEASEIKQSVERARRHAGKLLAFSRVRRHGRACSPSATSCAAWRRCFAG